MDTTSVTEASKAVLDTVRVIVVQDSASKDNSVQYLSLVIALLAVFFGPLISYITTKMSLRSQVEIGTQQIKTQIETAERNLRSEVLSRNRQEWINTLRDNISQFVALMMTFSVEIDLKINSGDFMTKAERLLAIRSKVALFINPKEDDHKKLDTLLDETIAHVFTTQDKRAKGRGLGDIRADIVAISQQILKREWVRVKNIE